MQQSAVWQTHRDYQPSDRHLTVGALYERAICRINEIRAVTDRAYKDLIAG